jgi:hypothetical protein
MRKILLTISIFSLFYIPANSQNWVTQYSTRGGFSFSFPQQAPAYDTLGLLTYSMVLAGDTDILFQVSFIDSVCISGNDEIFQYMYDRFGINKPASSLPTEPGFLFSKPPPCFVDSIEAILVTYAQMYQLTTQGTMEGFVTSDFAPCVIRGKELTIRHPNLLGDPGYYFAFSRYFYWQSKFLSFTISGPEEKLANLYSYKNQLFSSINILMID